MDAGGLHAAQALPAGRNALCIFEHVYLARPDSRVAGRRSARRARAHGRDGSRSEAPVEADLVIGIPDSGTPAAIGFSNASGIPFNEGLIKNRYVARTFIQPDQAMREQGIRMKFNPLDEVEGSASWSSTTRSSAEHDAPARRDAARRRRGGGPRADLVAAGRLSVLLRDRLGRRGRARRRASLGRGDARRSSARRRSTTSRSRACRRRRRFRRTRSAARASRATTRPGCRRRSRSSASSPPGIAPAASYELVVSTRAPLRGACRRSSATERPSSDAARSRAGRAAVVQRCLLQTDALTRPRRRPISMLEALDLHLAAGRCTCCASSSRVGQTGIVCG